MRTTFLRLSICAFALSLTGLPVLAAGGSGGADLVTSPVQVFEGSRVINTSSQPIVALSGTFQYTLANGTPHTVSWTQYFVSTLLIPDRGLQPQAVFQFPPTPDRNSDQAIGYRNVTVRGAVLANGRVWGPDGRRLGSTCADRARASRITLRQILKNTGEQGQDWLRQAFAASTEPFVRGPYAREVCWALRGLLYDSQTQTLKADPETVITDLIDRLGRF